MALLDRISKEIQEIDRRIDKVQQVAAEEIKELRQRKSALTAVANFITPELEAALLALEKAGIAIR